ncbi:MAG: THxN family PEP-CTERM protein [Noviherbaspirillum sp.]
MKAISKLALGVAFATFAAASPFASAAMVQITQTTLNWSNVVGGINITYNNPNDSYTDVRWGMPNLPSGPQSGLGFDPVSPPAQSYATDSIFLLGNLRHYNNPTLGPSALSVDLSLLTSVSDATPMQQEFSFRFFIDETPNQIPCAYPSDVPCSDKITFQNLDLSSSFLVDGMAYTIELLGFSGDGGQTLETSFISQEKKSNTIGLYARITEATPIPEPGSLALIGIALGAFAVSRRREKAASA